MLFKSPISTSLASLLVRASSLAALPHLRVGQGSGCDWTCISTGWSGSGRHWAGSSAGAWKGRRGLVGTWQCRSGRTPSTGACCNRRCLAESPGSGVISTSWLLHLVELLVAVRPRRPAAHYGGGRREPPGGRSGGHRRKQGEHDVGVHLCTDTRPTPKPTAGGPKKWTPWPCVRAMGRTRRQRRSILFGIF